MSALVRLTFYWEAKDYNNDVTSKEAIQSMAEKCHREKQQSGVRLEC